MMHTFATLSSAFFFLVSPMRIEHPDGTFSYYFPDATRRDKKPKTLPESNYKIDFLNVSPNLAWRPMSLPSCQEMLYPCSYYFEGKPVQADVKNWELWSEEENKAYARCCIYQTKCRPTSTVEDWFPNILNFFRAQNNLFSDFVLLKTGDMNRPNQNPAIFKWFWSTMKDNSSENAEQYHIGYVAVENGFLYEIYFVCIPGDFENLRGMFEESVKSFCMKTCLTDC